VWIVWAAIVLGALLAMRDGGLRGNLSTLAGRLGAAPGPLPGVVLLLVAAPFVVQAVLFADAPLILVAAVSLALLLSATRRAT
jgi:hypothetical protein